MNLRLTNNAPKVQAPTSMINPDDDSYEKGYAWGQKVRKRRADKAISDAMKAIKSGSKEDISEEIAKLEAEIVQIESNIQKNETATVGSSNEPLKVAEDVTEETIKETSTNTNDSDVETEDVKDGDTRNNKFVPYNKPKGSYTFQHLYNDVTQYDPQKMMDDYSNVESGNAPEFYQGTNYRPQNMMSDKTKTFTNTALPFDINIPKPPTQGSKKDSFSAGSY